jgi:hypothetical protein
MIKHEKLTMMKSERETTTLKELGDPTKTNSQYFLITSLIEAQLRLTCASIQMLHV